MGVLGKNSGNGLVSFTLFHPLDDFYSAAGCPLPQYKQIEPDAMPEPYRKLLVHKGDMTPTLENHYNDTIYLNVSSSHRDGSFYYREVILLLHKSHKAIEYGGIKINLALFEEKAQADILEGKLPLGGIMRTQKVAHASRPKAFFSVESDAKIETALKMASSETLYGRRNTLLALNGESLAEIVEILSPDR